MGEWGSPQLLLLMAGCSASALNWQPMDNITLRNKGSRAGEMVKLVKRLQCKCKYEDVSSNPRVSILGTETAAAPPTSE